MKVSYKIELAETETVNLKSISGQEVEDVEIEMDLPEEWLALAQLVHSALPMIKSLVSQIKKPSEPIMHINGVQCPTSVEREEANVKYRAERAAEEEAAGYERAAAAMEADNASMEEQMKIDDVQEVEAWKTYEESAATWREEKGYI